MNGGPELASTSGGPFGARRAGTTGPFLTEKLRALETRLGDVGPRVLVSDDDADAVHDLRVVLRRIRTLLETGAPVLGAYHAGVVRSATRDLMRASGALRDEEVLLELIASLGEDRPDVEHWLDCRRRRERSLRRTLRRTLAGGDLDRCRRLLEALLTFPTRPSRDKRVAKFARRAVDDARREVEKRKAVPLDDVEATHRLRIAFKRLRYTVEAFAGALPADLAGLSAPAARMQSRLGNLHDTDVALACVRRARSLSPPGREALVASLERVRAERAAACEQELGAQRGAVLSIRLARHAVGGDALRKISTR
jgi:CHAD domain-containing protein